MDTPITIPNNPNFLPPAKASKATQIPENAIRRMIKQGTCPGFYSGNRFTVNTEALVALLAAQTAADKPNK
ncbi:MAG: hypothetical protein J6J31_12290 [Thermoguttaceae bacterium]|nr:hypothetical protein [Thermoguttaceae bacterium]